MSEKLLGTERQADFKHALQQAEHIQANPEALQRLGELRELFSKLLDLHLQRRLCFVAHKYYEYGNKCGRMLKRALCKHSCL